MNNKEIWKDIPGYEGSYQVSNYGRVKRLEHITPNNIRLSEKISTQFKNQNGYMIVILSKNGEGKQFQVHRLVAQAFLPNPNNLPFVNHKDESRIHNNVENLEWCTAKYNNNYGTKPERTRKAMMGNTNGRKAWFIKRSEVDNGNDD